MKKLILLPLLFLSFAQAETIRCKVIEVIDGDSFTCLIDGEKQIKARLYQTDAPEVGQPYWEESKQALSKMILGRNIKIEKQMVEDSQAVAGIIYATDTICLPEDYKCNHSYFNINTLMLVHGNSWYNPLDSNPICHKIQCLSIEQSAKESKRGLWADPNPIPPWEWRKQNKSK